MNETDRAYLAATIDSEAYVGAQLIKRRKIPVHYAKVEVSQAGDFSVLHWLEEKFGGNLSGVRRETERHRGSRRWTVVGSNALRVLEAADPYLVLKREQADLVRTLHGKPYDARRKDQLNRLKHTRAEEPRGHRNLTDLWHTTAERLVFGRADEVLVSSLATVMYDQLLGADSMQYEFDISRETWMTSGRFTGLQRDYIDPDALEVFVGKSVGIKPKKVSTSQMQCRYKGQRHVSYKYGNCIIGFIFRLMPQPTFTMMSRVSAITRMGGLDLALAYCVASVIAKERGENVEDYAFRWHLSCLQHSAMTGLPYVLSHGLHEDPRMHVDSDRPGARLFARTCEYYDKVEAEDREVKLGTRKRIMIQRRQFLNGELVRPAVPLSRLNLDNLRKKEKK